MQDSWVRHRDALQQALGRALDGVAFSHGDLLREQVAASRPEDYDTPSLVCLRVCEALGGEQDAALPAAVALALVSQMGLVFGGLESQHGSASLSTAWGMPRTLNAGDAFYAAAQSALLKDTPDTGPAMERRLAAVRTLDEAALAYIEARNAVVTDAGVSGEATAQAQRALLPGAVRLGALAANVDDATLVRLAPLAQSLQASSQQDIATLMAGDLASVLDGSKPVEHST